MTTPLLEGTDGVQKMSKSLGNYIGITESPREMFGKIMSISDELMWRYYGLLTDLSSQTIEEAKASDRNPRDAKADLARLIVKDFHSEQAAREAGEEFDRMFRERQLPSEIPTVQRPAVSVKLAKLLADEDLAPSVSEARRLIEQGSVRVDGERITDVKFDVEPRPSAPVLLQVGKRKHLRIYFQS
jgi:tyrosyl-tRNA synthetase